MSQKKPERCWRCGHPLGQTGYHEDSLCPGCRTPTRVCRNCRYFSTGAANQCTQPDAEKVSNKQQSNSCRYFDST